MVKKQWFPITIKTSQYKYYGRWYFQTYEDGKPKPLGQIFGFGKLRIVLGD